jgi:hypothetical protein
MSKLRTYFTKDTVIIRNSCANTANNPITEIFHGGTGTPDKLIYSRYLFTLDVSDILDKVEKKEFFLDKLKHKVVLINTSWFDQEKYSKTVLSSEGLIKRSTGFDLILFKVPENWDGGDGYDYVKSNYISGDSHDYNYSEQPTNWFERSFNINWVEPGVYSGDPSAYIGSNSATTENLIISTQHFDTGSENFEVDITDYVNDLIVSGVTNINLGVAFDYSIESIETKNLFYVGFYSKETQTVYEPFMETNHIDTILDDRDKFFLDKDNRLYFYTNAGGERVNATFSGVTIYDQNDNIYQIIPSNEINQTTTGVYYVNVNVPYNPISGYCGNIQFRDVWNNVTINSNNLGDIELDFIIRDNKNYYNIGSSDSSTSFGLGVGESNNTSIYDYEISLEGIKSREKIKRGDTRKIFVKTLVPFKIDQTETISNIFFRIYIKEGETQIDYIDWSPVNSTTGGNYFIVDTSWFLPNDYYLEIKLVSGNEVRTYEKQFQFEIVSEKSW